MAVYTYNIPGVNEWSDSHPGFCDVLAVTEDTVEHQAYNSNEAVFSVWYEVRNR